MSKNKLSFLPVSLAPPASITVLQPFFEPTYASSQTSRAEEVKTPQREDERLPVENRSTNKDHVRG